jgi:cysteine desulfurase/selenocysteine lyase
VIYLDHAATSWPKPPAVREALDAYFGDAGGNPGRAGHRMSIGAARLVEGSREALAELLGVEDPSRITFAKNATEALNLAIYGLLEPGDHTVTSSVEHNSVMRPLRDLEDRGVELTVVSAAADGTLDPAALIAAMKANTRLVVTLHGSNVTGALLPIGEIALACRERGVPYLVDAAQTAGTVAIDVAALGIDLLAFTGHKGLLGLTGTGGLYVRPGVSPKPRLRGGTGSKSDLEVQPDFMPDIYESGTLDVAGIAGLGAGVRHLLETGVDKVEAHDRALATRAIEGLEAISGVTVYAPGDPGLRCGVLSFTVDGLAPSDVGTILDRDFAIMSRVGLHCAPGAHRTIGTFPTGTVRFGFGLSNTPEQVDTAVEAVTEIARWATDA